MTMNHDELKDFLLTVGVPAENAKAMAGQLEKRARQLAEKRSKTYEESLDHLVFLLKQGWAAKKTGDDQ